MRAGPIKIVVADGHEVVRTGFAALLETQPDFTVIGTAVDGLDAVRTCRAARPDVILMDVRMPGTDGIEATRQLAGDGAPRAFSSSPPLTSTNTSTTHCGPVPADSCSRASPRNACSTRSGSSPQATRCSHPP